MIPVIFIHKGYDEYLNSSVQQAKKFNKEVVIIGDHAHNCDNFYQLSNYFNDCDTFKSYYTHMSTNHFEYELFCIQRWFVLRNFMRENKIPVCFYLDSDVLLYEDVTDDYKNYNHFIMSIIFGTCAVVSFISLEAIENFCDYTMNIYANKKLYPYREMEAFYKARASCGMAGGVCDMTLIRKFVYQFPNAIGELTHPIDDKVYDHCVNQKDYFYEYHNGMKCLSFVNGKPYCANLITGKMIQFKSLHFQGTESKGLIKNYA
jgi:hypothetical protein